MDHPPSSARELLVKTAEIGEYFALSPGGDERWRALPLLHDAATLGDFVNRTRAAIAASTRCDTSRIPVRLAASSFQLGITARLMSPVVGAVTCFGMLPLLTARTLSWLPTATHFPRFAVSDVDCCDASTPRRAAELIAESLLADVLGPLNDKLTSLTSLPPQVAWGNVISAANGAVTVLAMSRPQFEGTGRALVRALLDTEPLTGTATLRHGSFLRRSCCLFYQAPGAGLCGDCVLIEPDRSR